MNKIKIRNSDLLTCQRQLLQSNKRIIGLVAGYRSGKTFGLLLKALQLHLTAINPVTNKSLIGVCCIDFEKVHSVFALPFCLLLSKYKIKYKYSKYGTIQTKYGIIRLISAQRPLKIVAYTMTGFIIDLLDLLKLQLGYMLYQKALGRLSGYDKAQLVVASTPEGHRSLYKIFVEEADLTKILFKARTTDNHYLPQEYIDQLYKQYDSKLVERYINGLFVDLLGNKAYYNYSSDSLIDEFELQQHLILHIGIDFNIDPMTSTVAVIRLNKIIIFRLFYIKNCNTERLCQIISELFAGHKILVYPDMTGRARKTSASETDLQILQRFGFTIVGNRNPYVKERIAVVNKKLETHLVLILKHCKNLINDFEKVLFVNNLLDKSNMNLTHISDSAGYLIYNFFNGYKAPMPIIY